MEVRRELCGIAKRRRRKAVRLCVSPLSQSFGWQLPAAEQDEQPHPQPQEDLPFLLLFTIYTIITATTAASTAQMMMVAAFSISQDNVSTSVGFL